MKQNRIQRKTKEEILQRDNYTCAYCNYKLIDLAAISQALNDIAVGEKWSLEKYEQTENLIYSLFRPYSATIDHKKPKKKGGTDEKENLVAACFRCNVVKGIQELTLKGNLTKCF